RQAQAIQIDHIVPLSEAWRSGASRWSPDRRRAFANDLDNLLAVDGPTNMSKSDDDPAGWRPRKGFQCAYAARWVETKMRWALAGRWSGRLRDAHGRSGARDDVAGGVRRDLAGQRAGDLLDGGRGRVGRDIRGDPLGDLLAGPPARPDRGDLRGEVEAARSGG